MEVVMIKLKDILNEGSPNVKKAISIAKKAGGDVKSAIKKIEKIQKGLSKHIYVKQALMTREVNEAIPKWPRINMGFGEAQDYSKMMIKKSQDVFKSTRAGDMGKAKKAVKDMEEIVVQIKRVLGI
jgi:hypothetical protein